MLQDFHFLRPFWLLALLPLAVLVWYMLRSRLSNRLWENICDRELLPYILISRSGTGHRPGEILTAVTGSLLILALAGPTWERLPQPVFQKESAVVIALDLSLSMLADDVQPSRLDRARFKISDLLDRRKEGQTALIVYAGDAFTVTPLTDDSKTIKSQLSALTPMIMPSPGSEAGLALKLSIDLLKQAGMRRGHILFISDEIDARHENSMRAAAGEGYQVSILGVGTAQGAPIKLENGSFLEAPDGSIVIPELDTTVLQKLAVAGAGRYETSDIADNDISRLYDLFNSGMDDEQQSATDFDTDLWYEFGPWLIVLALPLLALGFRRGFICLFAACLVLEQQPAMAFDWDKLWLNNDQRAHKALQQEQAEKAAELFEDESWRAAAHYRAGDYMAAEKLLLDRTAIESQYNRANALAKQGRYEDAIAGYNNVLEQQPEHEDARYNRDLVKQELERQQQNSQNQPSGDQQQQQEDNAQNEQQQQGQKQQQQQDDSSSQNSSEQQQEAMNQQDSEQEQQQQAEQEQQDAQDGEQLAQQTAEAMNELDEEQQASEQWLRRIPDDPSGLLRRKFKYQYQQRERTKSSEQYW